MPSPGQPTSIRVDPALYEGLRELARVKNKRAKRSSTIKAELETALRRHLSAEQSEAEALVLAPAIDDVLANRIGRLETRLASIMVKTGLDSATSLYLLLYLLDQWNRLLQAVQADAAPIDVQQWYEQARARAIKHFRQKDPKALQELAEESQGK